MYMSHISQWNFIDKIEGKGTGEEVKGKAILIMKGGIGQCRKYHY
jgi:hypothetical protein